MASFNSTLNYTIQNVQSGFYANVQNASTSNGALIIAWPSTSLNSQWQLIEINGSGQYLIMSCNSGSVMDVSGASSSQNTGVIQYNFHYGANQLWTITPVNGSTTNYTLTNVNSSLALGMMGGVDGQSTQLAQVSPSTSRLQRWTIVSV